MTTWLFLIVSFMALFPGAVNLRHVVAQGGAAREVAEQVIRQLGKVSVQEGKEALTHRLERLVVEHGDEVVAAAAKAGPRAVQLIESAGAREVAARLLGRYGDRAISIVSRPARLALIARHGDPAALALIRHGTLAEPVIEVFGPTGAQAMAKVGPLNARRLAILLEDGTLERIGRAGDLLEVVDKFGDRAMDFVWRNKGALAVGTVLLAFLADPEPFIDGARDLGSIVVGTIAQPIADLPGKIIDRVTTSTSLRWVAASGAAALVLCVGYRRWRSPSRPQ